MDGKFYWLHKQLVQHIIDYCKDNSIEVHEVVFGGDNWDESIKDGRWLPGLDSYLCFKDKNGNIIKESL